MIVKINELKKIIKNIYGLADKDKKYMGMMVWGAPGVGKSAAVKQAAEEMGIGFIDLRLSLLNPVDLRGLPTVDKEQHKAMWLEPEFLPSGKTEPKGILFLDEINLAPQSVMAAGYQLILDRKLGNYHLPPGWVIVAAGNRVQDQAHTTKFPAPLANRFIHVEVDDPSIEEWRNWAIGKGVAEEVVTFLSKMSHHLYNPPKAGEKAWRSPRSWEFASNLYKIGQRIDPAVGEGAASEFYAFLKVYQRLPDVEKVLNGKETKTPKANEHDVLFALTMALAYRCNPKQVDNVFDYIAKFPKEFEVLTIVTMGKKSDEIRTAIRRSKKWSKWLERNEDLIHEESE